MAWWLLRVLTSGSLLLAPTAQQRCTPAAHSLRVASRLTRAQQGLSVISCRGNISMCGRASAGSTDPEGLGCTGVKWGEASARAACQHCRTCRFDNVCLNHTSLEIQYFQDPKDQGPLFYDFAGRPHWSFPADFVNTGAPGALLPVPMCAAYATPHASQLGSSEHRIWMRRLPLAASPVLSCLSWLAIRAHHGSHASTPPVTRKLTASARVTPPPPATHAAKQSCPRLMREHHAAGHVHIAPGKLDWAPTVVRSARPAEASTSPSPVAVLASFNDFASNFGHALFDFLFPVFNQLQLLGLYHPDFQLLLAKHQVWLLGLSSV